MIKRSGFIALSHAFVEMLTLFSCMCMMASDTLTEMESAASSMLNGPSSFSETWYRASGGGGKSYRQEGQGEEAHQGSVKSRDFWQKPKQRDL